ncbi:IclR family transcriptional regulator [Bacillus ginsengihumi]|uniref:IclR family transcriptional regulator n=1 Tax=Heyndrickxia ginsengihumi TaxID=363870 RepID=A0A0A6XYX0_9BACI|nr:IclR family transcriptional regulator [Heyndrickxia ginsengihumi]KHD85292.1 IclR family transcriptional regulator [Heyndrickxia ginsengihumi]MBE6185226.1 IclR family transcriptional regulator [Bacillus sp. (in: firmicutes)]MCM3023244.1 IclR family transcriptional regulator [Heyndrickxia ginsengihumi]NEY19344.1 IclR family transcriptional regulator [Heyndrickxia ginsengihumi]
MAVKSAKRVLEVFELLAQHSRGLTIKEISEDLSMPQSSTSNLIKTLLEEGYLIQDVLKKYRLGPKLIQIGANARESLDIHAQGLPYLKKLMEDVEETVFLAVLSGDEIVYIAKMDSNRSIRTSAQPGFRRPLYCTGLGKAFLTFLDEEERNRILDHTEFKALTEHTITDRNMMEKKILEYQRLGYAIDDEESEEGLYCLAAPVFGVERTIQAAISVAGPKERMLARKELIVPKLLSTAQHISDSMGYIHA